MEASTAERTATNTGRIEEIQGVVIEASFPAGDLPEINNAIVVRRETLLPLQQASVFEDGDDEDDDGDRDGDGERREDPASEHRALVEYEPGPEEILQRLVPDYVEISVYRALLESTASEHGARMTAMRNASENAGELIDTYTLQMNRQRQADITQEIMEVVAGAESLV